MSKYGFLVPVAAAAAALSGSEAPAKVLAPVSENAAQSVERSDSHKLEMRFQTSGPMGNFVLTRAQSGELLAQHESHSSHSSHYSHQSHESHTSHTSHTSHHSYSGMA